MYKQYKLLYSYKDLLWIQTLSVKPYESSSFDIDMLALPRDAHFFICAKVTPYALFFPAVKNGWISTWEGSRCNLAITLQTEAILS